jgi:hypothetical protein
MDTVYHILRYQKNTPVKDLIFKKNEHMNNESYYDFDWASYQDNKRVTSNYYMFIEGNLDS